MKTIFYTFIFLFVSVCCWAQKNVSYVSFFPPNNVIHDKVNLSQNPFTSFNYPSESDNFTAKQGGLILGASDNSVTAIDKIILTPNGDFAIPNFNVENIIKVSALGTIEHIVIGNSALCGANTINCDKVFISANKIYLPQAAIYPSNVQYKVYSSDNSIVIKPFAGKFLPPIGNNNNIKWVNLRLDRTQECRRYLVRYIGNSAPSDNCNIP